MVEPQPDQAVVEPGAEVPCNDPRSLNTAKRCPWNWKPCESLAAATAALAASETHGEQETGELYRNCADEYIGATNALVAEDKWPVNGDSDHPKLRDSQQWRAECCDPTTGVCVNQRGMPIWKHWIQLKKQVNNEINVCLQEWVMTKKAATSKDVSLYSGSNWDEVISEVRAAYWKLKTKPKPGKMPPSGWTTPAFEVWLQLGYPAARRGGECHPALQMEANGRKAEEDDVAAGRAFLRRQSKRVKRDAAAKKAAKGSVVQGTGAQGMDAAPAGSQGPSFSPGTQAMLGELRRVGNGMDAFNARQDIITALQFTSDPQLKEALVAALVSRPGVERALSGARTPQTSLSASDPGSASMSTNDIPATPITTASGPPQDPTTTFTVEDDTTHLQ